MVAYTSAFDDWYRSRQTRAEIPTGYRNARIERELNGRKVWTPGVTMKPNQLHWWPFDEGAKERVRQRQVEP